MRKNFEYAINESGMVTLTGLPFKNRFVEVPREERFRQLYSYVLIDVDISYALEFLNRCILTYTDIDRKCYFQMAVIEYAKCYSPARNGGRSHLNAAKVYKGVADEPIECHNKFMEMRNKYFAHDENNFKASKLGAILNIDAGVMMGVAYPQMQAEFDYFDTMAILRQLCQITQKWVSEKLDNEISSVMRYVEQRGFEVLNSYEDVIVSKNEESD
jgi:hypothetical protein